MRYLQHVFAIVHGPYTNCFSFVACVRYSFNEETGTYSEIQEVASNAN